MASSINNSDQKIYYLEMAARGLSLVVTLATIASIATFVLALRDIIPLTYPAGLFAGAVGVFLINWGVLKVQSKIAKKNNINLDALFGKSRAHQILVEPALNSLKSHI